MALDVQKRVAFRLGNYYYEGIVVALGTSPRNEMIVKITCEELTQNPTWIPAIDVFEILP